MRREHRILHDSKRCRRVGLAGAAQMLCVPPSPSADRHRTVAETQVPRHGSRPGGLYIFPSRERGQPPIGKLNGAGVRDEIGGHDTTATPTNPLAKSPLVTRLVREEVGIPTQQNVYAGACVSPTLTQQLTGSTWREPLDWARLDQTERGQLNAGVSRRWGRQRNDSRHRAAEGNRCPAPDPSHTV
jgi:hypothetical protein